MLGNSPLGASPLGTIIRDISVDISVVLSGQSVSSSTGNVGTTQLITLKGYCGSSL